MEVLLNFAPVGDTLEALLAVGMSGRPGWGRADGDGEDAHDAAEAGWEEGLEEAAAGPEEQDLPAPRLLESQDGETVAGDDTAGC